jgi:hypothetical protein
LISWGSPMHEVMVGVHFDDRGAPLFFGWDEVNDYIRHGMRVVALKPGDVFRGQLAESDTCEAQPSAWYFKVVLDDYGIDPA